MTLPPELPERDGPTDRLAPARRPPELTGACRCGHPAADHFQRTGPCYRPACGCNTHRAHTDESDNR